MIAMKRLKGLGQAMLAFMVAIACYLVSLQVAIERNKLGDVNAAILDAKRDIRQLETEFTTRASYRQLERWNGEVLALSAPASAQFITDERQLASMDFDLRPDEAGVSPTMLALVSPATLQPEVQVAVLPAPRQTVQAPIVTAIANAVVPTANAATRDPKPVATPKAKPAKPDPVMQRMAEVDTRRAQRVAMLEDRLLGDDTLGDLARAARAEARGR